jgi:transcriptional regulator with XRE-family HTH domain
MTLKQVAEKAGISESYMSRIERGDRVGLKRDTAIRLAQALGLKPEKFLKVAGILEPADLERFAKMRPFHEVVRADPNLTARQKRHLIETYELFVPTASSSAEGSDSKA